MVTVASPLRCERLMQLLHEVPDPEIPALSVVDLGVVRELHWDDDICVVTITPTYSGCPAMREISEDIVAALQRHGVARVRVDTRLAPAWTTDWLTERGRDALRASGIAAPAQHAIDISGILRRAPAPSVACPLCGSTNTRMISHSGSTSCKALYRCVACREPFDYFKAH